MFPKQTTPLCLLLGLALGWAQPSQALAVCTTPLADVTSDEITNVIDVQCVILTTMWGLSGSDPTDTPPCLDLGPTTADINCDSMVTVVDVLLTINSALNIPINDEIDGDGDMCPDDCQATPCGDGTCNVPENCSECPADCGSCPNIPPILNDEAYQLFDLVYRTVDGQDLALDVRVPAGPGPFPAVFIVHGGGFSSGDKATGVAAAWAEYLPTVGYASISANYRLSGGGPNATGVFPGPLQDVKCALRWTRSNAEALHINPDSIYSLGHSAGGYFAGALVFTGNEPSLEGACSTATTMDSSVAGGVDFYGVSNFATLPAQRTQGVLQSAESNLLGGASCLPGALEPACSEGSPNTYVNQGDPPIYLLHANNDPTIPVEQSQELHQQLQNMGLSSEYLEVTGLGHGWAGTFQSPFVADIRDGVVAWLDALSGNEPEESGNYPLYFTSMTHLEGEMAYDEVPPMFNAATSMMQNALALATEYDAKLTIESEKPFALACELNDWNFLEDVIAMGHGVGTHCDIGYDIPEGTTQSEYIAMLAENKSLVDALIGPENNKGCSGGGNNLDWVDAYIAAGYSYANGAVGMHYLCMPESVWPLGWDTEQIIVGQHSHEQVPLELSDRMYMRQMADSQDFIHDPGGALVLSGGGLGRPDNQVEDGTTTMNGYSEAFTEADVDAIVAQIIEAREEQDKTLIAKLNVHLSLDHFQASSTDVLTYFFAELQSLQDQGIMVWATELEVYEAYMASLP